MNRGPRRAESSLRALAAVGLCLLLVLTLTGARITSPRGGLMSLPAYFLSGTSTAPGIGFAALTSAGMFLQTTDPMGTAWNAGNVGLTTGTGAFVCGPGNGGGVDDIQCRVDIITNDEGGTAAELRIRRARVDLAAISANTGIGQIKWQAHNGTDADTLNARISATACNTQSATNAGGELKLWTVATSSTTRSQNLNILNSGNVLVGLTGTTLTCQTTTGRLVVRNNSTGTQDLLILETSAGVDQFVVGPAGDITTARHAHFTGALHAQTSFALGAHMVTVANNTVGASANTEILAGNRSLYFVDCNDPDGCTMQLGTANIVVGAQTEIWNISTNANTLTWADVASAQHTAGSFTMGESDVVGARFISNRSGPTIWSEKFRSNN